MNTEGSTAVCSYPSVSANWFRIAAWDSGILILDWLHWSLNRSNPDFLPFMVMLHWEQPWPCCCFLS
jgi:hypothetical protein